MAYVVGTVVSWVDNAFPGWVEVVLHTVDGDVSLVDKVPAFGFEVESIPSPVQVECVVDRRGPDVVTVTLSHGIGDGSGASTFRVPPDLVIG